jgi:hypothetical protein
MSYSESIVLAGLVSKYITFEYSFDKSDVGFLCPNEKIQFDNIQGGYLDMIVYYRPEYSLDDLISTICCSPHGLKVIETYIETVLEYEPDLFEWLQYAIKYTERDDPFSDGFCSIPWEEQRKINIQIAKWLYNRMRRLRIRIRYEDLITDIILLDYTPKRVFNFLLLKASNNSTLINCLSQAIRRKNKYAIESIEKKILTSIGPDKEVYWKKKIMDAHVTGRR